ncbi:methylated-DNA--[protein]-cysteine S-methyltransferase [Aurantiacibacter gangjinensis]|uniref:methylated-DNA--[protein]-cysteine S-methyltransferase n=1 Tax=Aurantiacibacter gangjinensis TaxID=502682 RepID=UPI000699EC09|nr:methylated-DNA--[protein]-cysteine S-methyltransferase [Aurantiacibacter gangjinensis]APE29132.1 ADA regulatory protein / Methylated-DNA--protein-cysteine methyltransferase [Aurantiacibacter gangjinensis]
MTKTIHFGVRNTALGPILVAASDKGVCSVRFGLDEAQLCAHFPEAELVRGGSGVAALFDLVANAVDHPGAGDDVPLDIEGTDFQKRVWAELRRIPIGETRSYGELAAALGAPGASRAVGSANGANKIAVLIPCHRVLQADGSIGGYAYGPDIKRELLRREGALDVAPTLL